MSDTTSAFAIEEILSPMHDTLINDVMCAERSYNSGLVEFGRWAVSKRLYHTARFAPSTWWGHKVVNASFEVFGSLQQDW